MEFRQGLATGTIVGGDYRIVDVLGQGGFGLTYKGFDTRLGSQVAIKEYFPADMALREDGTSVRVRSTREEGVFGWGRDKFLEEARTLARFRHSNIVRVARLFEENNTAYMVLDFEQGPSLAEWRANLGRAPRQDELDRIAERLLDAVAVVHSGGILHRDIKPQNIIMRGGVDPVLIDFGAARASLGQRSKTVHAIVTPGYSPKEQYALDVDRQGPWTDIYALGATFYFLVTGYSPPDALTRDLETAMPMETDGQEPYRESFLTAIDIAMEVRAEDRPQAIDEWRPMLFSEAPSVAPAERRRSVHTRLATELAPQAARRASEPRRSTPRTSDPGRSGRAERGAAGSARSITFDEIQPLSPPPSRSRVGAIVGGLMAVAAAAGGLWYYVGVYQPGLDDAAWQSAVAANTVQAYETYIANQPNGRYLRDARARRQQIAATVVPPSSPVTPPPATPPAFVPNTPPAAPQPPPLQLVEPVPPVPPIATPSPPPTLPVIEAPPQPQTVQPSPPIPAVPPATPPPSGPQTTSIEEQAPPAPLVQRTQPRLPARDLPPALTQAELAALQRNVASARWRLAPFFTQRVVGFSDQQTDFVAELDRLTGGRLAITVINPDEIGGVNNIIREAARSQTDLFGWHTPLQSSSRRRAYFIFAGSVPFGLAPVDHVRWLRADGARLLEQIYARDNWHVRVIPCGIAGSAGGWFRREIKSPADFRGMKIRATTLASDVLQRLGATPVAFQNSELAQAFGAKTVDAVLNTTPVLGVFTKTPLPAPVYHYPSWHSPSYLLELMISPTIWNAMSEPQQKLVDEACRRNLDKWAVQFQSSQTEVLTQIRNVRATIRPFTGPTNEALRKATEEVLAEEANKSAEFRDILESYNRFRR